MIAAKGDRRPCIVGGCSGEMQYGRRSDQERGAEHSAGTARDDRRGWVCSQSTEHFTVDQTASVRAGSADEARIRSDNAADNARMDSDAG
jgi:hypothetical protein